MISDLTNLKTVVIDIANFNEDDSLDAFAKATSYKILPKINPMLRTDELFIITDSRRTADIAVQDGIGFAAYLSDDKVTDEKVINDFPDSLYLITSLSELTDTAILKMYQRANNIPWTIAETERTIIREITVFDIDELYGIYSDPETVKYIEKLYENEEDEITFTENYIKNQYRYFEYGLWAVTDKDGRLIGRAGIFNREGYDNVELGFVFERSKWGMGFGFEVCSKILEYAKAEFGFTEFIAFTKNENTRGRNLLERLGFKYKEERELNGEMYDMFHLSC